MHRHCELNKVKYIICIMRCEVNAHKVEQEIRQGKARQSKAKQSKHQTDRYLTTRITGKESTVH